MRLGISVLSVAVLGAVVFFASPSASLPEAETFVIDPVHSTVLFRINHMGVSNFWGRFNGISGELMVAEGGTGSVDVTIDAASVDTASTQRDGHLKSPDFFSVVEFPQITFKSDSLKHAGGNKFEVKGTLTLHGVSKEISFPVERIGAKDTGPKMGFRAGFEGTVTFNRSDFGMKYGVGGPLGDEVKLILSVEAQRK